MIFTDRTITVRKGESRIDEPIVVYRGDYELEVRFTILNSKFRFMSGTNLIESEKASYGQLAILTPYGGNIFSDIVRCNDGSVTFVLTAEMLNQIEEVGLYSFQIRLMDYTKESRVSIPPIEFGIEVREPIASEDHDNSVNNAIVGYSIAKVVDPKEEKVGDTFDGSGNYNKTKWETGDRISEGKLNKIEDAIDKVNKNEINNSASLSRRIDNNFNVLDATKADQSDLLTVKNRIDNLAKLSEGSTTGDAELIDGRIGADGRIYPSLGESIRQQIKNSMTEFVELPFISIEGEYIYYRDGSATTFDNNTRARSDYIKLLPESKKIYISNVNYDESDLAGLAFYDINKHYISGYQYSYEVDIEIAVPDTAQYIRFSFMQHPNTANGKPKVYQEVLPYIFNTTEKIDRIISEVDDMNAKFIKRKIVPEIEVVGKYVYETGEVTEANNFMISKPISVMHGEKIFIKATGYKSNVAILSEYNGANDYSPLVVSMDDVTVYEYMTPRDMRLCLSAYMNNEYGIEVYRDIYDVNSYKRLIDKTILSYELSSGYVKYMDGQITVDTTTTRLNNTGLLDIQGISKLYVYGLNYGATDNGGLAFYDKNGVFISGIQYTPCTNLEVDIPKDAVYVNLTVLKNTPPTIAVNSVEYVNRTSNIHNGFELSYELSSGYVKYMDGQITVDTTTTRLNNTGLLDIQGISKLYVYGLNYGATDNGGLAFYDKNGVFISGIQYTPCTNLEVDIPKDAVYVNLTVLKNTPPTLTIDSRDYIDSKLNDTIQYYYEYELTPNTYISYKRGDLVTHDNSLYNTTGFIRLIPGHNMIYIYHGSISSDLAGFAFYGNNYELIEGVQLTSNREQKAVIPEAAVYIRCTIKTTDGNDFIRSTGSITEQLTEISMKVEELQNPTDINDTFNYCQIFHKIAGIGDSLMSGEIGIYNTETQSTTWIDCYNYSWLSNLCKNIGAQAVHYSSGGRTTKTWLKDYLDIMKAETEKPSAYFIALGTNDTNYVELGTEEDCDTDAETFYGMYSKIINEVKNFNPNASIFCFSLYYNPNYEEVINYCSAIRYMADKYGCYYIDFINAHPEYSVSGEIRNKFVASGHFTTHGYVRLGQEMLKLVNEAIYNDSEDFKFMSRHYKDLK